MSAFRSSHLVFFSASELAWLLLFVFLAFAAAPPGAKVGTATSPWKTNSVSLPSLETQLRYLTNQLISAKQQNYALGTEYANFTMQASNREAGLQQRLTSLWRRNMLLEVSQSNGVRLAEQLAQLRQAVGHRENKIKTLTESLRSTATESNRLRDELRSLTSNLMLVRESEKRKMQELGGLKEQLQVLKRDIARSGSAHSDDTLYTPQDRRELLIRSELLGLKGRLGCIAFVVDTSMSMSRGGRWDTAQKVIATWLEHLPIRECRLILFNEQIHAFPSKGTYVMTGDLGRQNRIQIQKLLKTRRPEGETDTLSALVEAYSHDRVDTIILFTDGEPNVGGTFAELTRRIEHLCRQHPKVIVNTVGLGDYFKPSFAKFLLETASKTGGTFVGR